MNPLLRPSPCFFRGEEWVKHGGGNYPPVTSGGEIERKENRARAIKLAEQIEAIMRSEPNKSVATDAYTIARSFFFQK